MKRIINGIVNENPVLVLLLGLCSALAITNNFENSYIMGICVTIVLICSNLIVSLINKYVTKNVEIPVYILIISTLVTVLEILLKEYVNPLYKVLGIYLPLIVVNCIVLGRALSVASKENVKNSVLDGLGVGLGYTVVLMVLGLIREVLGNETITIMKEISNITHHEIILKINFHSDLFPINIFNKPAGAFITLACLLALFNYIRGGNKNESN